MNVKTSWIILLLSVLSTGLGQKCQGSNDACINYQIKDEPHRSIKFSAGNDDRLMCDNGLVEGWYRFKANGQDINMPTTCVDVDHCGTVDPIWMQGSLPAVNDGAVERMGCINHGDNGLIIYGGTKCCHETIPLCVKNCNGFYVYRLSRTSGCSEAYCAGDHYVCPIGKFGPNCVDMYPKMTHMPVLQNPQCDNGVLKFPCHVPFDPMDINATFEVTWTVDGQPLNVLHSTMPVLEILTGGKREAYLDAINLMGNLGKRLQCKVTSYYPKFNLRSDPQLSNEIFCGVITNPTAIKTSENGLPQTITLTTSLPQCAPLGGQPSCDFAVEIKASDNFTNDVSTSSCTCNFKYNTNIQKCEAVISVIATRDFLNDGNKTHTLSFRPIENGAHGHATLQSLVWVKHQISPVQVTTTDSKSGVCISMGDPHIATLPSSSRTIVDDPYVGDFVLYKVEAGCNNINKPMEIHIRTQSCTTGWSCVCGVVARDGNDIIEVNGCTRRKNAFYVSVSHNITSATTLHTDASGNKYYINFQSGARLTITSQPYRKIFSHVQLEVPSDHNGCTKGLCGSFENKLVYPDGKILPATHRGNMGFAHSWMIKPENSMFNKHPPYNSQYDLKGNDYCQCNRGIAICSGASKNPLKNIFQGGTGIPISTKFVNNGKRQLEQIISQGYSEIKHKRSATWPTTSGFTESKAFDVCNKAMEKSSLYRHCGNTFEAYSGIMHGCVEDIMSSDSLEFVQGYTFVYTDVCLYEISVDVGNYIQGQDGQLFLANNVTSDLCPSECNFQGTCHEGVCQCDVGYQEPGCSVKSGTVPVIISIHGNEDIDNLCDIRHDQCLSVFVIADHIFYSPQLQCRVEYYSMRNGEVVKSGNTVTVGALFRTFNEIECPLPSSKILNGDVAGQFKISVTADGINYSNVEIITIYDSLCQNCSEEGICFLKPNTCLIENQCHRNGEQNAKYEICEPTVNQYTWINDTRVMEIDHFTASLTGCFCSDDPESYTCACCQNEGCPCGFRAPHQCVDCNNMTECGKYPNIYDI